MEKGEEVLERNEMLVAQSCPALCNLKDCSLLGSSVHGVLQARILEWVAIPFSKGSSQPRDGTWVSCIAGGFFTVLSHLGSLREGRTNKPSEENGKQRELSGQSQVS